MRQSLEWQIATLNSIKYETERVKTLTLSLPRWVKHLPGQHYDIRLTAPDGYQAQRSYSIASEPERVGEIDLTIERIEEGEISTYLHDILIPGDRLELRGPIGGFFVWHSENPVPVLLVAGGSGVVPLMAMVRHRFAVGSATPFRLLYSSRSFEDIIYCDELERLSKNGSGLRVDHALTRSQPPGWNGYSRRIDQAMLAEEVESMGKMIQVFICGPTLMVESAGNDLVSLGIDPHQIRTERFGPSGQTSGV